MSFLFVFSLAFVFAPSARSAPIVDPGVPPTVRRESPPAILDGTLPGETQTPPSLDLTLTPTTNTNLPYPGMLPDSPLYIFKSLRDKILGLFVFGEDNKALYSLFLSEKRLSEVKGLSDKGEYNLASTTAEVSGQDNEDAQNHLANAFSQGKDVSAIIDLLAANSARQQAVLTAVLAKVPEQAKQGILNAMEKSRRGLIKAQEMQSNKIGNPEPTVTILPSSTP